MRHATSNALQQLAPLVEKLRALPGLVERTPGSFYHRSNAFLHFHEDPAGLFADAKLDFKIFERYRVNRGTEQSAFFKAVVTALSGTKPPFHALVVPGHLHHEYAGKLAKSQGGLGIRHPR